MSFDWKRITPATKFIPVTPKSETNDRPTVPDGRIPSVPNTSPKK
jgi:hypothetical protein